MNKLIVFVKAPVAGQVKTRLCPPLAAAQAADLYRAFVQDTLDKAGGVPKSRVEIAYEPFPGLPDLSWLGRIHPPPFFLQQGDILGEKLQRAFARAFAQGASKVVIMGSDAPHIPSREVSRAFRALDGVDMVLGPARDGGYYLVGLRGPCAPLFHGIPWSTAAVSETTLARARDLRLSVELLTAHTDIDNFKDLKELARMLLNKKAKAPRALRAIRELIKGGYLAPLKPARCRVGARSDAACL